LGAPLTDRVDTFLGIAGGNWGLSSCILAPEIQTCNDLNGFYPGYAIGPLGLSSYLSVLNDDDNREGQHVFSISSRWDEVAMFGGIVYGRDTCEIPGEDDGYIFLSPEYTHMALRDDTAAMQYDVVTTQRFSSAGSYY
jgi:triacylglycerol lipase